MAVVEGIDWKSPPSSADTKSGRTTNADDATFAAFGKGFVPAISFKNTYERIADALGPGYFRDGSLADPPAGVEPWACRIGASRFYVPPININVNQVYKAGSMAGSAIRQQNSPKFNTGHAETIIQMTLYFPNYEEVWGFEDVVFDIDFDNDDSEKIDRFLSSLRGLIAQFKYAPFLPIKNDYINRTYGITGVVLRNMTISTIENYPFAMAVNLEMAKFNHRVYLPMVADFDNAIHWGRFRQYMGRAASRLAQSTRPLVQYRPNTGKYVDAKGNVATPVDVGRVDRPIKTAEDVLGLVNVEEYVQEQTFARHNQWNASRFDFFYPFHTPARVDLPSLEHLQNYDVNRTQKGKNWWQRMLGFLGVNVNTYPEARFEKVEENAENFGYIRDVHDERKVLADYMKRVNLTYDLMGPGRFEDYVLERMAHKGISQGTGAANEFRIQVMQAWFGAMYHFFMEDATLSAALAFQDQLNREITINEWELPMVKLNLDPKTVIVKGVSVSLGNTLAKLQLQMQDEPTYQHIGGQDARVDISLTVTGPRAEEELAKIRQMFESINGLARLEHGHGVLGFLGVQHIITELVGVRYAIPLGFEIDTIPNQPHSYNVRITLTDFDVFQQKREQLTTEQQATLIEAFGKRNPFFRVKQLWGVFNGYPDFPLAVRDEEGKIVGHLEPDFYFRAWKSIDDDLVDVPPRKAAPDNYPIKLPDSASPVHKKLAAIENRYHPSAGTYDPVKIQPVKVHVGKDEGGAPQYMVFDPYGLSLYNGDEAVAKDLRFNEVTAANMNPLPNEEGLTPLAAYQNPYFGLSSDPAGQFAAIAKDMQYRDKAGRMVRAFPTYMLWLIDEGGNFAGMKMFDNFYGLQSVLDFSIVQSEDILGDTLMLRISNLYSKLSTPYGAYLDEEGMYSKAARIINTQTKQMQRLLTGLTDQLIALDTIELKPGVRLHLRMGYSSDPNAMETVFNGVITQVETGDIMTVTAQSDAIELSALVNTTNEKGHTGKIDGNMMGLYLSEPRDLMIQLLTMGSSVVKETIAHATQGKVFSESRFGIKHFGTMMYEPLTKDEKKRQEVRREKVAQQLAVQSEAGFDMSGSVPGLAIEGFGPIFDSLWANMATKRDYEIFKRNIYPGNGIGIAQYMGGDLGDIGLVDAILNGQIASEGDFDPRVAVQSAVEAQNFEGRPDDDDGLSLPKMFQIAALQSNSLTANFWVDENVTPRAHTFLQRLNIVPNHAEEADEPNEFDEVSFRAQTHMKTVWDLFRVCAGLLPDYIVAVRPFEDRSTVFYGKPHWNYTSGLIPLSLGVRPEDAPPNSPPEEEVLEVYEKMEKMLAENDAEEPFNKFFSGIEEYNPADPSATSGGGGGSVQGNGDYGFIARAASEAGFTGEHLVIAVAIALGESGGNPKAINTKNKNGSIDYGLWQINSVHRGSGFDPGKAFDPQYNANWAYKLYKGRKRGFQDWVVYNKGLHIQHMDTARKAVGTPTALSDPSDVLSKETQAKPLTDPSDVLSDQAKARAEDPMADARAGSVPPSDEFYERFEKSDTKSSEEKGISENEKITRQVYEDERTPEQAEEIWEEFRQYFKDDESTKRAFMDADALQNLTQGQQKKVLVEAYDEIFDHFKDLMWNNPYARGWVVRVVNRLRRSTVTDALIEGKIVEAGWRAGMRLAGAAGLIDEGRKWDFGPVTNLFRVYVNGGAPAALEYMKNNHGQGKDFVGFWGRALETVGSKIASVFNMGKELLGAVAGIAGTAFNYIRLTLLQMTYGLSMASNMQKRTNQLNRMFNDSFYYQAGLGPDGKLQNRLLYMADNPFTREYGEPVAEIREPFQRMHTIGSFQHIIKNGIIENMDNVATVVTATSNGKHPQTVHFDKGAPAERQFEKVVDTGLMWDQPKGWMGFKKIFNPIEGFRHGMLATGIGSGGNAASSETSAKRIALWHLKESLKDIYQGEVTILGDPSIRPHDLVYLGDVYERMYGFFEVEQVVHHFTPETGFITSITPNACVTINDPARWVYFSHLRAKHTVNSVRDHVREMYRVHEGNQVGVAEHVGLDMTVEEIAQKAQVQIENSLQYTQGWGAAVKGMAGAAGAGALTQLTGAAVGAGAGAAAGTAALATLPVSGFIGGLVWNGWKWVRDNLLDQHGCYIQYLTHNGQPMDASLSYNEGVAVGQQNSVDLVLGGLKVGTIPTVGRDGSPIIRTQDVIKSLQWDPIDGPNEMAKQVDMFVDLTNAQIRGAAGRGTDGVPFVPNEVYWVRVTRVIDSDTFEIDVQGTMSRNGEYVQRKVPNVGPRVRFAMIDAIEDPYKNEPHLRQYHMDHPGVRASQYAIDHLEGRYLALRVVPTDRKDIFKRTLAYVFHNAPERMDESDPDGARERRDFLLAAAGGWPEVSWDSFLEDGRPYTFNWQLLAAGYANTYTNDFKRSLPGRGVRGARP